MVIILEVINSAIENIVDMVCGTTFSTYAKNAKDMAAGAVLLMSICSAIVGLIIFVPKVLALLFTK
jgi:undecaprenol kinase